MSNDSKREVRRQYFIKRMPVYRRNPVLFAEEICSFQPDKWQETALMDLAENPKVAIKSGQGVGKTSVEAIALLWFLCCFPFPRVVATAPTKQQLHDVLWSEVSKWISKSPLLSHLLKWTKTYIYLQGYEKRWFAVARTATKPENMQGFHEDNMLFIVDEASGVSDPIMEAVLGTLSGSNNKLLLCGNPTKKTGVFYDAFTADCGIYRCHTVSSADSPRTDKDNIASLIRKYGKDSNFVRVRVYGEFPKEEDDLFFDIEDVYASAGCEISEDTQAALGLYGREQDCSKILTVDIGVDVARFGDDDTVISYRINELCRIYKRVNGKDIVWTFGNVLKLYKTIKLRYKFKGKVYVKIDNGGVGGGVIDNLFSVKESDSFYDDLVVLPINFGQPIKNLYYYDSTTYMLSVIRNLISTTDGFGNAKKPELILPNDSDLIGELTCRKYHFISNGKQQVESKEDMKKRGLHSPDTADSIALCCLPVRRKE